MNHAKAANQFNRDAERSTWHDQALWHVRQNRDRQVHSIPDWEDLRVQAAKIKAHTLSKLDEYLTQFETQALANGIQVHWASDAETHNEIVFGILQKHGVKRLVKSKSMLTEECHLNPYLEKRGIEVTDTDLGERIVQLANEAPSHIVMPAIHKKKEEIGALFHEKMGTQAGASDPQYLTEAARQDLRRKFLEADAALTGVNFAIAETGGIVVCTNEGNADLGMHLAPVHIHCMGLEKVIPRLKDLSVFLRLLARSATGQPITSYSSHVHGPREGTEMHIVLLDNGRSMRLSMPDFRQSLHCIRCGACMNTCPVYRRSGGHSYGYVVPGPIGAVLTPGLDMKKYNSLAFASTLCGSCNDVCPVKIDLHQQLYKWRQIAVQTGHVPATKTKPMKWAARIFAKPQRYDRAGKWGRRILRLLPAFVRNGPWNPWGRARDLPQVPRQSFKEWYQKERK